MDNLVVVLGDSLSIQRPWDSIEYKDIYSYKLAKLLGENFYVINKGRSANYSTLQIDGIQLLQDIISESDFYIIQLGVVDCFPRLFTVKEQKIISMIKPAFVQKFITNFASKNRPILTKLFHKTYVSRKKYRRQYEFLINQIIERTKAKKIFIINIPDTNEKCAKDYYGLKKNIKDYNEILKNFASEYPEKVELVDLNSLTLDHPEYILHCGHHVNKDAHEYIAKHLDTRIRSII